MRSLPEEIVKKKIIDRLSFNGAVNINNIYVTVKGDSVTLEGQVSDYKGKLEASRDAAEEAKGYTVINELQVYSRPGGSGISDKKIDDDIRQYFKWQNSINPTNVKVHVNHGKVVLSGYVRTLSERVAAGKIVSLTKGVTGLDNRILVRPNLIRNDEAIERELHDAFEQSALIERRRIKAKVNKGTVYLAGHVDSDPIRKEIEEQALHIRGVSDVINKNTVG